MTKEKCINCKTDISELIYDAIEDSRRDNWDGYYKGSNTVCINCVCGCLNEVEHENGMVIVITKG